MDLIAIEGVVVDRGSTKQIKEGLYKRILVLHHQEQWNSGKVMDKYFAIELFGKTVTQADNIRKGYKIIAKCNLNGRSWTPPDGGETKYFLSLQLSGFDDAITVVESNNLEGSPDPIPLSTPQTPQGKVFDDGWNPNGSNDPDLPF